MLHFDGSPPNYLVTFSDVKAGVGNLPIAQDHVAPIAEIVDWAESFLTNPHPDLGREGAVRPYTSPSMMMDLFWLTVYPGQPTPDEAYEVIIRFKDIFLTLHPTLGKEARYKTILIVFPDVPSEDAPSVIDATQDKLKAEFVQEGLMVGQFHSKNNEGGLWNPYFRPLRSPVPLLAIRHMVETDLPFLVKNDAFMRSYLDYFGGNIPMRLKDMVDKAVVDLGLEVPNLIG